jgi:heme/copper-type cytochrome/quinol oxidase subunit 1
MNDFFEVLFRTILSSGIDWTILLVFLIIAAFTFLTPVVGYRRVNRSLFMTSLWLLLALMAVIFLQSILLQTGALNRQFDQMHGGGLPAILLLFSIIKAGIFLIALVMFLIGLHTLHWGRERFEREDAEEYAPPPPHAYTPPSQRPPRQMD